MRCTARPSPNCRWGERGRLLMNAYLQHDAANASFATRILCIAVAIGGIRHGPQAIAATRDELSDATVRLDADAYQSETLFRTLYPNGLVGPPPQADGQPTTIHFGIELEEIRAIDAAERRFRARGFMWMYWEDRRADVDLSGFDIAGRSSDGTWSLKWHADAVRRPPMLWDPQAAFVNADSDLEIAMETFEIFPQGFGGRTHAEVEYWCQFSGWFSDRANLLDFHDFPFDTQRLPIDVVTAHPRHIAVFAPCYETTDEDADVAVRSLLHPEWMFEDHAFEVIELAYVSEFGRPFSLARTLVSAKRIPGHHVMSLGLPIAIIMVVFNCVIWIRAAQFEAKLGGAITCLLSLIAFSFVVNAEVPRIPYLTALGWYINTGYGIIVAGTVLVVLGQRRLEYLSDLSRGESVGRWGMADRLWNLTVSRGPVVLNLLSALMVGWLLLRWLTH